MCQSILFLLKCIYTRPIHFTACRVWIIQSDTEIHVSFLCLCAAILFPPCAATQFFSYIFDVIAIACEMNGLILLSGILFNCLFRGQCCRQVIDVLFSKEEAPGFTEVLSALFLFSILLFSSEYSPNSRFLPRPSVPESADIFSVPTRKIGDCPKETPFENLE